ncbi:acetylornithine aminotransferase [Gordoniibacillus kamchatkensis]|uniref:Acetylornithine aminotransferase n=1 Tax=Gordoniibacillus kamchatkensis TaxID=1590651 RepID=A0ABR5AI17_9BACL|nr:aspartate aminotransferase family protein [Paenibacillus sp. VKM B-2647]KIL40667.1 acetylornithine aminotransferase [Paenibacillus sp. VKM B-2647]
MSENLQGLLFPNYSKFPITLVKGEGSKLWDDQGKEYIDLMCGVAVTNLGHVPAKVKAKLQAQLDELWHVSNLFHIPNQYRLAELLTANSCADHVFFCNSGAEANEAAIKLARRYYQKVKGMKDKYEIVTFKQSFHGRTLATLTATGQDKVKEGFHPLPEGFTILPYNDIEALRGAVSGKTAAVFLELVQGEGGIHTAEPAFVAEIAKLCEEHDALLILDEIQTGMGRTGKMFAYEHYDIEPDIFTLAKGLGSGFPIGAVLGKAKLKDAFAAGSHGSTFGGNLLATAAGIATVETMLEENVPQQAAELGEKAAVFLRGRLAGNPIVNDVRGKGLLIGIECTVAVGDIVSDCHRSGALVITAGTNVLRLVPSLVIPEELLLQGLTIVCEALERAAAQAGAAAGSKAFV